MTTTAKKAAPQGEEPANPFSDVSDAQEQAAKDAQEPVEFDKDTGEPKPQTSEAAAEVAQEMSVRATAQASGGGPWPEELLLKNFVGSNRMRPPQQQYTSHEDSE
jgi:hypothetical protein